MRQNNLYFLYKKPLNPFYSNTNKQLLKNNQSHLRTINYELIIHIYREALLLIMMNKNNVFPLEFRVWLSKYFLNIPVVLVN